jgi:hypothetical protein
LLLCHTWLANVHTRDQFIHHFLCLYGLAAHSSLSHNCLSCPVLINGLQITLGSQNHSALPNGSTVSWFPAATAPSLYHVNLLHNHPHSQQVTSPPMSHRNKCQQLLFPQNHQQTSLQINWVTTSSVLSEIWSWVLMRAELCVHLSI